VLVGKEKGRWEVYVYIYFESDDVKEFGVIMFLVIFLSCLLLF